MTHPAPHPASLDTAYAICRGLHRTHGRSYYLATKLLPAWKRRHVHALYGFTRYTDDIVDAGGDIDGPRRARQLGQWADQFYAAIEGGRAPADPVLLAVRHTIATFGLSRADFDAFFASMEMDLHVRAYADYGALLEYMRGSAAVIGTMMLPILLAPDEGPGPQPRRRWTRPASRPASSAWRSSSPTSSATSARTSAATACTCPRPTWKASEWAATSSRRRPRARPCDG